MVFGNLSNLMKLMSGKFYEQVPKESIDYSKVLVNKFKENLDISKKKFNERIYNESIYYLCRATLYSSQALLLLTNQLKLKDIENKNFNSFREFVDKTKYFDKLKKILDNNKLLLELFLGEDKKEKFKKDYEEYKKFLEDFIKSIKDKNKVKGLLKYDENQLQELLNKGNVISQYQTSEEVINSIINLTFSYMKKIYKDINVEELRDNTMIRNVLKKELEKNKDKINFFGTIIIVDGLLMIHEEPSNRYIKDLEFSPEKYNQSLGIVKIYDTLYKSKESVYEFEKSTIDIFERGLPL